jgi:hypothetical protein
MVRISLFSVLLLSQIALASFAFARNNANLSRDQIRSMHILDRPSRPGHFYGNAVRRKYNREMERGSVRSNPGNGWQGAPAYSNSYEGSYQTGEVNISE